ncbi:MAG TPA: signal peptidase I [Rhodanobacteraceae bacterium]|nr:signal peptidase I [Rhodanobacteraceae bacterium]
MNARAEPVLGNLDDIGTRIPERPSAAKRSPNNRPRKPWLALVLGIVHAPIAFAYVGRAIWGLALLALQIAIVAGAGWSGWMQSIVGIWTTFALAGVALLIGIFAPWIIARGQTRIYEPRWYNRWYGYLALFAALALPLQYAFMNKERVFGFGTYRVPSASMLPTIAPGDFIVVDTRPQTIAALHANDVVIVTSAAHPGQTFARRIVGMPGQHVLVGDEGVTVDGEPAPRAHVQGSDAMPPSLMKFADVTLGADELYLMGDNRANSLDSRTEGPHVRSDLRGKITTIWFSHEWWRLGHVP